MERQAGIQGCACRRVTANSDLLKSPGELVVVTEVAVAFEALLQSRAEE